MSNTSFDFFYVPSLLGVGPPLEDAPQSLAHALLNSGAISQATLTIAFNDLYSSNTTMPPPTNLGSLTFGGTPANTTTKDKYTMHRSVQNLGRWTLPMKKF
jgi:hypothetical protein